MSESEIARRSRELLGAVVRVGGVRVGVVTAVLMSGPAGGAFGFEVSAGSGRWFLPCVAAEVDERGVNAVSALFFGGADQLAAYLRRRAHVVRGSDGPRVLAVPDGGTTRM